MKSPIILLLTLLSLGNLPSALWGQDSPPANLAEVELARSRDCVGRLARLGDLNATLEPIAGRLARLDDLGRAVLLEKTGDVTPFDEGNPLEEAVAEWFASDSALAVQFLASPDSTIRRSRAENRARILDRINEEIQAQVVEGREMATAGATVREEAQLCEGALFVRSAVLEACATTESPICEAAQAAAGEPQGTGRFVDSPEDLWDVEQYRPWTQPSGLQPGPNGALGGARSSAQARRGNVIFSLTLAPLIQSRSELPEEEIRASEANLDSLGFTFDHPSFVMAPGLELTLRLPAPLGGETHLVVHFGDLSGDDVIWTIETGPTGLIQVAFPALASHLARLRAGEPVSLTALRVQEEEGAEPEAEAVFTLTLLQVGQVTNVGSLLEYMGNGSLSQDLATLIPPGSGG